jgi:hypothetical protein
MERTLNIDGKDVKFKATAGTIRQYRALFGRDLLLDFQRLQDARSSGETLTADSLLIFENMAYVMARQADPTIPDTADEWLDGFEMFSIYVVLPQLVELWQLSNLPLSQSKKK